MDAMTELTRLCREIADAGDRLDELAKALDRCPAHKKGTRWWVDRLRARTELATIRERLVAELTRVLTGPDLDPFARAEAEDADWLNRGSL